MMEEVLSDLKQEMEKTISGFTNELKRIRTGRASTAILDGIRVDYYGNPTPLNQLATVSAPEPRLIIIQPWDAGSIGDVEKAIQKSDLGLTPQNDGKVIRINIPNLTEERRKELVKTVKKITEDFKVTMRNHRRDSIEFLKEMKKEKEISEDGYFGLHEKVQEITDEYIKNADTILAEKEKEIMEI
ncbi:MAG: ribosome recycling factor [Deltaproteobacteria bacterium]|nr:ribosome recycling factor [Candidatus Zymogenaceae bacterium]